MSRSPLFPSLRRLLRVAEICERRGIPSCEGIEIAAERATRRRAEDPTRREFLQQVGVATAAGVAAVSLPMRNALARASRPRVDVGIVGAGIAGLCCADTLARRAVAATLYEGRDRIGGRMWSMGGAFPGPVVFPGQVVERGGELIDTTHITLKGYARELGLALEDVTKAWLPGDTTFVVDGAHVPPSVVVDEYRELVGAMRRDLVRLSSEVTALSFTHFDRELDLTSLAEYLDTRGAAPNIRAILDVAYTIEYGLEIAELSALALLFFIHADRRSRFQPFGVFSDERYHVLGGNEQIVRGLAARLPGAVELGARLVRVAKTADGRIELGFERDGASFARVHEAVVLALPFSMLREVDLDLDLPPEKRIAIQDLRYGTNAKLHVGFDGRFWGASGSDGTSYSNLPNHQTTWEPNPRRATPTRAVLLDYSGGERGARLDPEKVDAEVERWLGDLEVVYPGATAAVTRVEGGFRAHLQHWPSDPFIRGSYTANHPGYFTTIEGHTGTPVGNLYFAGEHTDPFYEWQGFMEGGANSGIRAADRILRDFR